MISKEKLGRVEVRKLQSENEELKLDSKHKMDLIEADAALIDNHNIKMAHADVIISALKEIIKRDWIQRKKWLLLDTQLMTENQMDSVAEFEWQSSELNKEIRKLTEGKRP